MKRNFLTLTFVFYTALTWSQQTYKLSISGSEKISESYNEAIDVIYERYIHSKYKNDKSTAEEKINSYYSKILHNHINLKEFSKGKSCKINIQITNDSKNKIRLLKAPNPLSTYFYYKIPEQSLNSGESAIAEIILQGSKLAYDSEKKGYTGIPLEIRILNHNNDPIIYLQYLRINTK
ncbi:hypothetical protein SAMN05428642_1112 [Flaviramulus basaltis]|uniref:Uncharacterized protein n=1 Tax=Flaviramulus basaltis TaxID=369401 RepID=A0A1K2IRX8_9FLAO|nr:hypothetical protein [Flaviramulus basaltis]SFZ95185.1 hypothetical protein SAMN05428642_1112 [Flaviramulus basaltis]